MIFRTKIGRFTTFFLLILHFYFFLQTFINFEKKPRSDAYLLEPKFPIPEPWNPPVNVKCNFKILREDNRFVSCKHYSQLGPYSSLALHASLCSNLERKEVRRQNMQSLTAPLTWQNNTTVHTTWEHSHMFLRMTIKNTLLSNG